MAGENDEIDFDHMSDEDFLKMSEEDAQKAIESQKPSEEDLEENTDDELESDDTDDDDDSDDSGNESDEDSDTGDSGEIPEGEEDSGKESSEVPGQEKPKTGEEAEPEGKQSDADTKKKGKKTDDGKLPDGVTVEQATQAVQFMQAVTASFKADGKDIQVTNPSDVIRLMQQGANYSRRMQELKPLKAMSRMLSDHGLNDPNKLSFLIDISKGDKTAIAKLLKDNNLDPMDLDTSSETKYQAKSYAGTPKENEFRDALDNAISIPEGQALVSEIHKTWDPASKERLRENPALVGNLVELKRSGIYQQVADELHHQRTLGYLTDIPYLQAFDQVGEAMRNAGVLKLPNAQPAQAAAPLGQSSGNPPQGQPVASGGRKAPASKKAAPNPHLSSTPPSKQPNSTGSGPDFDKLSDEEFLKMPPPE